MALGHIQQATLILLAGNLLVNLLAFVKSVSIAAYYGTSAELDAYFLALAPLNLISGVFLSAIQAAFIPRYIEIIKKEGIRYAQAVFRTFVLATLLVVGVVNLGLFFGSSILAAWLGTGFTVEQVRFTAMLLKSSTILLMFTILSEIGQFFFNAHRRFVFSAAMPLVSVSCSLLYLLMFHERGAAVLMHGLILGMGIQCGIILDSIRRFGVRDVVWLPLFHPDIRRTFGVMLPLLIGASFGQVNVVVDQMMAATLPAGSIAALNFAIKLHSMLTQMFIMVISRAVLPFFAQQVADNDPNALTTTYRLTIRNVLLLLLPLSALITAFGVPIVQVLFQRGAFSADSTVATAGAWIAYTIGLPFQAVGILTARVYNALQDNRTLMYVSGASIVLNILLNWIGMRLWGHVGIALSTSVVYACTTVILVARLNGKIGPLWRASHKTEHEEAPKS